MISPSQLLLVVVMFSISIAHRALSFQRIAFGAAKHQLNCKWSLPMVMSLKTDANPAKRPSKIRYPKPKPGEESRVKPQPKKTEADVEKDRPFTLPPGLYRPKQSLGQNFLSDQNYVVKIIEAFSDYSDRGRRVLEIGPGPGALTRKLFEEYPDMTAVEIDQRGCEFLSKKLPGLNLINMDILEFDWAQAAVDRGGPLSVIANLPYNIVSQVIFMLADNHKAISQAVLTMQWEVGARVTAMPNTKEYGIPSVVFQLYGKTKLNFKIPPKVFYPVPKVDSALVTVDFTKPHPDLHKVDGDSLRKVITLSFQHRRKMLRVSLRDLCEKENLILPEKWALLRPEQLRPAQFLELTADLYGVRPQEVVAPLERNPSFDVTNQKRRGSVSVAEGVNRETYSSPAIWRKNMFAHMNISNKQKAKYERMLMSGEGEDGDSGDDGEEGEEKEVPKWKQERDLRKSKKKAADV